MIPPVAVNIPESLRSAIESGPKTIDLPRWVLEAMVVEAVREGLITGGRAGQTLGLTFEERERFLAERGVVHDYSEEELGEQQQAIDRILAK